MELDRNPGRKITGVTPKFFIKDEGTTYTSGEEYNGIWSLGGVNNPTGYADIGHWRLLERRGHIGFNGRSRDNNNLRLEGFNWGSDSTGVFIEYKLPNREPLPSPTVNQFITIGTGGSFNPQTQWSQYLTTPGFDNLLSVNGPRRLRYQFDIWAWFFNPPASGETQTILALSQKDSNPTTRVEFRIRNSEGQVELELAVINNDDSIGVVGSKPAADLIYNQGGLHHIGFIVDADDTVSGDIAFGNPGAETSQGFYVDGTYFPGSGSSSNWRLTNLSLDVNPLIGCKINGNPTFNDDKTQESPAFISHFTGKIYMMQMNTIGAVNSITKRRMNTLYNLQFDIPRGPTYIDLSDRFEYKGKNFLKQLGDIEQIVDHEKGNFHVTIQNIRTKN